MFSHPVWLMNAKITDMVQLRMLSGNEYVHVQIHVLFMFKSMFLDLLIIGKTNVMQN